ncbi:MULTISPECIES: NAD-dependent epimerase/dehydratase family protein [Bacteroides]|uniref:polysaccharide biosynthesis C-terminal domain-containing protein n=1 Tax=Bacteroides TaxID=816 RepID=UPI002A83E626|nr:NAD-dependent epimerase/dehydratase family protein [Bacteroides nordii]
MIRVGITGQSGFIGTHLYNELGLHPDEFLRIPFEDTYFQNDEKLRVFVAQCDVIVHLAGMNRCSDPRLLYNTNVRLVNLLITAMEAEMVTPHVFFSSSTQEERDNEYGKSKREGRILFEEWARRNSGSFTGLIVPNVYGPFGRPDYNSFIATFCYKLTHGSFPQVLQDSSVKLIYVSNLCKHIIRKIYQVKVSGLPVVERDELLYDFEKKVSEILDLLEEYRSFYFERGIIPVLKDSNEINLFNTFCSYMDFSSLYPRKLMRHEDPRGIFVETVKLGIGGQVSFSITVPGVTRGNHYHTRKIERFIVIKGKAKIQLRRIGTDEVLNFFLDGNDPCYVDMPIWYTHNITNIGDEDLYTQFWINEWFDPKDGDTFFESCEKEECK